MQKKTTIKILVVLTTLTLACSLPVELSALLPEAVTADPPAETALAEDYPSTPEAVVQEFLSAYEIDPTWMAIYLSRARLADMPPGGTRELVQLHGGLEGFHVTSAAINPDPPAAMVSVAMRVGGNDTLRVFTLVMEDNRWVIDSVEIPPEG